MKERPRLPETIAASMFDLDGALTRSAELHAAAWKQTSDASLRGPESPGGGSFVVFAVVTDYDAFVDGKPRASTASARSWLRASTRGPSSSSTAQTKEGVEMNNESVGARPSFSADEAREVGEQIGIDWDQSPFDVEQFRKGMDVELEHGLHDLITNVTGDEPTITGKIALAHLNEFPDYYTRLARMEEEAKREHGRR